MMGTGMNVQHKLIALHHLDCPNRPADIEQREGRIIRQGNTNETVQIYNYVTKGTFDAFMYQMVERKQRFISSVMTANHFNERSVEDIDEATAIQSRVTNTAIRRYRRRNTANSKMQGLITKVSQRLLRQLSKKIFSVKRNKWFLPP